jgi:hypothetical protein
MSLAQSVNRSQWLFKLYSLPVIYQFVVAQLGPGQNEIVLSPGHCAGEQGRWHDGETCPVISIAGVEVGLLMVSKLILHRDDDAIEP